MALSALHGTAAVLYGRMFVTLPIPTAPKDIHKQTFIVTGSNTGLGFEAVKHLSRLNAGKVIMAVRTISKGETAKSEILKATQRPEGSIEIWQLDMDSYDSVKKFAERVGSLERIDGVLANAGIMTSDFSLSEGYESTLNINVISTFLLYALLLPKMRDSYQRTGNPCRFSIPNSALHYMAPVTEIDLKTGKGLLNRLSDPDSALMGTATNSIRYNLSKLLVIYAVRELALKTTKAGITAQEIIINTPNPSFCVSNLGGDRRGQGGFKMAEKIMARSTEEGSRALVHGVLAGFESNGQYLNDCHVQTPASSVTSKRGQEIQKFFFSELLDTLEKAQPGISANF